MALPVAVQPAGQPQLSGAWTQVRYVNLSATARRVQLTPSRKTSGDHRTVFQPPSDDPNSSLAQSRTW